MVRYARSDSGHDLSLTRRGFLKFALLGLGSGILPFRERHLPLTGNSIIRPENYLKPEALSTEFPKADRLGRVCVGKVDLKASPNEDANSVGTLFEDAVVPWVHEKVGTWPWRNNQRWVETPEGYIWSPYVQPVLNQPNRPLTMLPETENEGIFWVEVTVPYVDAVMVNPPPRSHWFAYRVEHGMPLRFFYSQILSVDQIKTDEQGQVWYRVNERYGNPGDLLWAPGEAFRPLEPDELAPINPEIEDKHIVVNVSWHRQTLSCFEGSQEVYYCRISSGVATGSTPLSAVGSPGFAIWRKLHSIHMSGGTNTGGWDLPGIGWTALFHGEGVAIHSTYWHNNFGEPMSHGCVNTPPTDAKWIFRWSMPVVPYDVGDNTVTLTGDPSTRVKVIEA